MPVMGGVDAIKEIRSEPSLKTLPCIAISAYSLMHEVQFYLNIGFDCYIPKPFKLSEIHDTLDKYLDIEFIKEVAAAKLGEVEQTTDDFSSLVLPKRLYNELKTSSESNDITGLKNTLKDIALLGHLESQYSLYLTEFLKTYEFEEILSSLETINYK